MYSKKYMYEAGQKTCLELIGHGFLHAFEEVLNLMRMNKVVRKEAERGLDKKMPKEFRADPRILQYIKENLTEAEQANRKGAFEDNYKVRMKLGKYFHELEGYQWLANYFYKSSQIDEHESLMDISMNVASLEQQALLEEDRGNPDIALKYLEKGVRILKKNSPNADEITVKRLNERLCRIYHKLVMEYFEKEGVLITSKDSKCLKFFKRATKLAMMGDNLENQATSHALLGKVMMKYNKVEKGLKSFELYIELCEKCNDMSGMCQGYFAVSEIFKKKGDLNKSTGALNMCQKLAQDNNFDTPFVFASISLGQIATAKRQYFEAYKHFEEAYQITLNGKFSKPLIKLSKVMYGIGRAHLNFGDLIKTMGCLSHLCLPKLFHWKSIGGSFTGDVEKQDHMINLEETEQKVKKDGISEVIEKMLKQELSQT